MGILSKLRLLKKKTKKLTPEQLEVFTKEVLKTTQKAWWRDNVSSMVFSDLEYIKKESEKYYNPMGKVKLTESMKKRLFSTRESIDED